MIARARASTGTTALFRRRAFSAARPLCHHDVSSRMRSLRALAKKSTAKSGQYSTKRRALKKATIISALARSRKRVRPVIVARRPPTATTPTSTAIHAVPVVSSRYHESYAPHSLPLGSPVEPSPTWMTCLKSTGTLSGK